MRGTTAAPMLGHEEGLARALALGGPPDRAGRHLRQRRRRRAVGCHLPAAPAARAGRRRGRARAVLGPGRGRFLPPWRGSARACGCGSAARSGRSRATRSTSRPRSCISRTARGSVSRAAGPSSATSPPSDPGRIGGIEVLLNATRTQAFDPALFTDHGIALAGKKLVVVKSAQHFHAGFARVAKEVLWLDGQARRPRSSRACPIPSCGARSGRSTRWRERTGEASRRVQRNVPLDLSVILADHARGALAEASAIGRRPAEARWNAPR